jgi:hypothetical protein
VDAYTLIGRVDDEGFERLQAHDGIRYVTRTVGSFSAFAAYEVEDIEALGRIGRDLDLVTQGSLRTVMSVSAPMATSASADIPTDCVDTATLTIDWECVGYEPPRPSHLAVKPPHTAFAVCSTLRGAAGDGEAALRRAPGVRAFCELADPGSWLAEVSAEDSDDLLWALDQLARGDVFGRVRSGVVVRGRGLLASAD